MSASASSSQIVIYIKTGLVALPDPIEIKVSHGETLDIKEIIAEAKEQQKKNKAEAKASAKAKAKATAKAKAKAAATGLTSQTAQEILDEEDRVFSKNLREYNKVLKADNIRLHFENSPGQLEASREKNRLAQAALDKAIEKNKEEGPRIQRYLKKGTLWSTASNMMENERLNKMYPPNTKKDLDEEENLITADDLDPAMIKEVAETEEEEADFSDGYEKTRKPRLHVDIPKILAEESSGATSFTIYSEDEEEVVKVDADISKFEQKTEDDNNIKFMFLTRSSTANSQEFDPFPLYVKPLDEMKILREKAINYCHSATDIAMDKLASIRLNVKGGRVVPFKKIDNDLLVKDFLDKYDLTPPLFVIMPLNTEMVGGGKRGKPAGGHYEFNLQITQKLSSMLVNIQGIATSQVDLNNLKAFFDAMSLLQLEEIIKICNSKLNNSYKMESIMLYEPTLSTLVEQIGVVEDFIGQFKKKFTDTFTLDDIKEEILIQKRIRAQVVAMPLG